MTFDIHIGAPSGTGQGWAAPSDAQLTATGKFAVWAAIVSMLFLSQIALNIGDFPVTTDLVCYALFACYLLVSGYASLSFPSLLLFLIAAAVACFRMVLNDSTTTSWTSLALLFALYAPFSFHLRKRQDLQAVQRYIQYAFVSAVTVIASIAVAQIILVNVFKLSSLTNIYFVMPKEIRGAGAYTFLREGGGIVKANGFFLRESADLSMVTGLALMVEYYTRKRLGVLGIIGAGFVCSFSGTGILAVAAGFLLPRSISRIPLFFVSTVGVAMILFVLYSMELPGLSIWFGRLSEFTTPNTSAYSRFVAPVEMVQRSFDKGAVTTWLGTGGGTFLRDILRLKLKFEINDPTWSKLTYEYGLLGFGLCLSIFAIRLYSSSLRVELCNFFLYSWISIGLVLKPSFVVIVWLLTLVPKVYRRPASKFSISEARSRCDSRDIF
jgi:hypothetical protein